MLGKNQKHATGPLDGAPGDGALPTRQRPMAGRGGRSRAANMGAHSSPPRRRARSNPLLLPLLPFPFQKENTNTLHKNMNGETPHE